MDGPSYEITQCVVCGGRDAVVIATADDVRAEIEALWEYHAHRLEPGTPPRRLADRVAFSEDPPLHVVRCTGCGFVYRNPIERPGEVHSVYVNDAPARDSLEVLHVTQLATARAQARRVRRILGRGGSGVEVGSYVGAFLVAAKEAGLSIEGIDVNADVNDFARQLGAVVHDGELRDYPCRDSLDVVAIWNAFDQLADPRGMAHDAWRRLRPGGLFALRLPNGSAYARLRRAMRRGGRLRRTMARATLAQNNLLTFPYRWGFTPESIDRLLSDVGFRVVDLRGDALVPTSDEWTRRWARWEERLLKGAMTRLARLRLSWAPWFEVFATKAG